MPRKPRFYLPDLPVHAVQRGHSREPVFYENADYQAYLGWLREAAERYRCAIHAYVLMTNHVHVLATPSDREGIIRMMQYVGRRYVPYIHFQYGSSGTLWEGRYKASLVQEDDYLLTCMRYIELNPVRAKMVNHPREYRWSSYRSNAEGRDDPMLTPHKVYLALAKSANQRKEAYRALFKAHVDTDDIKQIRAAWQTGTPLGNEYFKEKVEARLKTKIGQARRGRPSKRALTP
ncbi:MAG: transposase [Gammaproteobacteria bacterium]|nr:MAG: transposase [Gammaproteobacteria bacterium]TND07267.1 MAG: transposase [Gammaproteobacteria bacterium]